MLGPTAIELLYDTQTGLIYFCFVWLKVQVNYFTRRDPVLLNFPTQKCKNQLCHSQVSTVHFLTVIPFQQNFHCRLYEIARLEQLLIYKSLWNSTARSFLKQQ